MGLGNLDAVTSAGVAVVAVQEGASKGCTLSNSTTYYFPIIGLPENQPLVSVHLKWASALVATFTLEVSDFPKFQEDGASLGSSDITDYSTTAGDWQQVDPPSWLVPVTGSGNTSIAATVTAGGSAAGAAVFSVADLAAKRLRIKVVVTTGALVRCAAFGKESA